MFVSGDLPYPAADSEQLSLISELATRPEFCERQDSRYDDHVGASVLTDNGQLDTREKRTT